MVYHNISLTQYFTPMNRPRFIGMVLISILSLAYCTTALAQARVVATIKPLQMIASAITEGVSEPDLLIPPHQSYHHFVLRPSTVRTLQRADLVVWVGPQLETYLADTVARGENSSRQIVQALNLPGLHIHLSSDADPDHHSTGPDHHPGDPGQHSTGPDHHSTGPDSHSAALGDAEALDHGHGLIDPHVWLDTHNAGLIATAIAAQLTQLDPANSVTYEANLAAFTLALDALRTDIRASLRMPAEGRYAVYHNAFQYFEREFGLDHAFVFVASEELQPSVRHMLAVREAIGEAPLLCLMEDVTSQPGTVRTLLGGHQVLRVQADTTGRDLDSGADSYLQLINGVADAFRQCFGQ